MPAPALASACAPTSLTFLIDTVACLLLATLAWCDWSTRRLSNVLIALLVGLAMFRTNACALDLSWGPALLVLTTGMLLVAINVCGAGDVKLLSACILLITSHLSVFLFTLALVGGVLSLAYGVLHCHRHYRNNAQIFFHPPGVPYGVAIALTTAMKIAQPYLKPG